MSITVKICGVGASADGLSVSTASLCHPAKTRASRLRGSPNFLSEESQKIGFPASRYGGAARP